MEGRGILNPNLPFNILSFSMKVLTWNYQGAGSPDFSRNFRDITHEHRPQVVFIMETRVFPVHADLILPTLGYSNWIKAPTNGMIGGILVVMEC